MDGFLINLQDEKETSLQAEEIHQTTDGLVTPKSVHLDTVTKTETKTKTNTAKYKTRLLETRSLGALRRPFGPLDFVLHSLRPLRPCDPRR